MKLKNPIIAPTLIIVTALFMVPMAGHGAEKAPKSAVPATAANISPAVQENISSLIKELESKDYNTRSDAVNALAKIGAPAVPAIIESLANTNSNVRKGAVDALGNIGNARPEVVPALVRALTDRDSYVRKGAAEALGKIGAIAIPSIINALADSDSFVRRGATEALGNIGTVTPEVVPSLINALEDSDGLVRRSAVESLGKIGPVTPDVIPSLKKMVGDGDFNVRKSAVEILEKRNEMTADLKVKHYILDLSDNNSDIRKSAIEALNKIGPVTPEITNAIITALGDSDYSVRKISAEFLEKRGSMTAPLKAKKHILDLKYGNKAVRIRSVEALSKLGAVTPEVIPSLITAMEDKDMRDTAIEAIGLIGPDAKDAVPALTKALSDTDINVRTEAADAIGKIGPVAKSAIPYLEKALKDNDSAVRTSAADALEKLGSMTFKNKMSYFSATHPFITAFASIGLCLSLIFVGSYSVPVIWRIVFPMSWNIRKLQKIDAKKRISAVQALAKIGKPAIPSLIKSLSHKKSDVRISASEALNKIGTLPPKAIPLILKFLRDKESEVRKNITEVLGKTGPLTTDVVPALIRAIGDSDSYVRASAAEALGKIGPEAPEVIPALMKALGDSFHHVRDSAGNALEKCGAMHVDLKVKRCITDFRDTQTNILSRAIEELESIGPAAIPELTKALGDSNSHIRRFAAAALEKHNALTVELKVKRYILDLGDSSTNVRARAAEALANIGPEASEAIPHLTKLIGHNDYYVRLHSSEALEKLGAITPELKIKRYILDLGDSNSEVRSKAAEALCAFGPAAKEALPKLKKLLADEDEIVCIAAEKAISIIESSPDSTAV